ncbi:hypothetical protein COCSUDRAFT_83568 [Coccomyxa subellipsoidea C-169]|uniref:Integrin alpha N-terminal domain-containing protein n=1 Tax=Coccomyxa subellipsoidea (strain C-169) TaxID=574566 RepID=I0Z8P0_COCSC|nr:hypothetical protein COCSUDRAFT_83568 [Coccomyxa subellipsoidea C-169]EIE27009.1 hypothetical protein COCSUDRAFT_83568 [Coccomyxa subellipsoidea C-169]|eukprot:XP_005651553.1 hypothetical protein COCSUDRAFT_83568 [Coccomyxa subellipsoidea C-169]
MYKRDFAVLILSAFAIYFTIQHEGAFSYRRAWYTLHDQALLESTDVLPPPVAADLNGDGRVEVITATHDAKLQVYTPYPPSGKSLWEGFAKAALLAEVSLAPDGPNEALSMHRAVALAAGYLDPKRDELVLVVVTANWDVICFDHNLRLQWTARVKEDVPHGAHMAIKEVAIHISNHTARVGDRGIVVIGGSVDLGDLAHQGDEGESDLIDTRPCLGMGGKHQGVDISRHFSYYAFDGGFGALRWKHEANFHRDTEKLSQQLLPALDFRMDAAALEARHFGEVACRDFRESVLAVLPHRWARRSDTRLQLAHFVHHRPHGGDRKRRLADRGDPSGGPPKPRRPGRQADRAGVHHSNPVAKALGKVCPVAERAVLGGGTGGAAGAAQHSVHGVAPNVLVAHLEEGIEAVHLYSGRTLCKLHLPSPGLHADLNGDGVLDHVQVAGGHGSPDGGSPGHRHTPGCWAVAKSGIPPREPLFNATICRFPGQWGAESSARAFSFGTDGGVVPLEVAPPAFLPVPGPRGLYQQGHGLAAFLNSRGEVTAYNAHGERLWQHAMGLAWSNRRPGGLGGGNAARRVAPTLEALPLRAGAIPAAILASGSWSAVVLSEHGNRLETLQFPALPALPLQILDFNGDGLNDIVLVSHDGLYGWAQVRHPGGVPFAVLIACLIVAMAVVYFTQQAGPERGRTKKGRSTDRVD